MDKNGHGPIKSIYGDNYYEEDCGKIHFIIKEKQFIGHLLSYRESQNMSLMTCWVLAENIINFINLKGESIEFSIDSYNDCAILKEVESVKLTNFHDGVRVQLRFKTERQ